MTLISSILYFDIFNHPLKLEELAAIQNLNLEETKTILATYQKQKTIFELNEFYSISEEIKSLIKQRKEKELRAKSYFTKLPFYVKIIKSFPFVKGIAISGSLSKGVMHDDGDIDYFIITSKNRLWICRTLLILFKKIFLLNSRKYFCLNYFVDEDNLEIKDKNIFTAVEIKHLLPVYNFNLISQLKQENLWTNSYFKGATTSLQKIQETKGGSIFKTVLENVISGNFAEKLDLFFMRLTCKRWANKFNNFNTKKLELTMRSNRGVSKHHPSDFQTKVLAEYNKRLDKLTLINEDTVLT